MAACLYGDEAPSAYIRHMQDLRAFLVAHGQVPSTVEAEPMWTVNTAKHLLWLYGESHREMTRLADYLREQGYFDTPPAFPTTVDTVMALLEQGVRP